MTWLPWLPWLDIYLWGLRIAAVSQVAFVAVFATTRWWTYRTGRALFIKSSVLAVMLCLTWAATTHSLHHLLEVATVLMWVMALAVTYLLWSVVRQKYLDRRNR